MPKGCGYSFEYKFVDKKYRKRGFIQRKRAQRKLFVKLKVSTQFK